MFIRFYYSYFNVEAGAEFGIEINPCQVEQSKSRTPLSQFLTRPDGFKKLHKY
jgi:hypothetical protein